MSPVIVQKYTDAMSLPTPASLDPKIVERFTQLIGDIRFAMLTTQAPEGGLRSRPMAMLKTDFDGDLWFFTDDDSPKVEEITDEHHVGLSFANPSDQKYVSVSGRASVIHDKERALELWTPAAKAWFPRGVDDPHLGLLRVRVEAIEYWDSPSSKMVQLYGFAKAVLTGNRPKNLGEHKKIDVTPPAESV